MTLENNKQDYDEFEEPLFEDVFGTEVYEGDTYYDFDGELVFEDNLKRWVEQFEKEAGRSDYGI